MRDELEYRIKVSFFKEYEVVVIKYLTIQLLNSHWKKSEVLIYRDLELVNEKRLSFSVIIVVLAIIEC